VEVAVDDRRPTMEDVAARAGVSRALVSIVFRDAPGAGEQTRARVRAAAAELGYRPDNRARLLGRSRTGLVGVVFGVRHTFHTDLVESLYAVAEPAGYELALSGITPARDEGTAVEALLAYRCEALVCLGSTMPARQLGRLASAVPTVVVARRVRAAGVDVVRTDDADGLRQAVAHLVELGHTRIAHVDGAAAPGAADRRRGYRTAMRRAGLERRVRVVPGGLTEDDGARAAETLLNGRWLPTALAAFNDRCAVGLLHTLRAAGRAVPGDVSVVGFDDDRLASLPHIDLTTLRQDPGELARLAVSRVVERLERSGSGRPKGAVRATAVELVIPPQLVVRGTTSSPPTTR
jgi:DNA-binding LacI/PurR family transcriptional regulator